MTYEQFWYEDPWMVRAYAQAYLLKRKIANEEAWINGAYVYNALTAALATAFGKTKVKYIAKPADFFPKTEAEVEEEKRQKRRKLIRFLNSLKKAKKNTGSESDGKP